MQILRVHKRQLILLAIFCVCLFLLSAPYVFAQDTAGGTTVKKEGISGFMYDVFVTIGGAFLWLGGQLLDITIQNLVVGMSGFLSTGVQTAINSLWEIIRDLLNIVFIFALIFIGFKTILGSEEARTRRWLISLIGAAILINFSLYFTQVVIDFSNTAATQIYDLIVVNDTGTGNTDTHQISQAFMQLTKIETYAKVSDNVVIPDAVNDNTQGEGNMRIIVFGLLMMIFMVITAFVFAAGAFMLIGRFIILVLCMIFSPAMFLGWIFPGMEKFTNTWVQYMLRNAFVAPVFLFMLYLSLRVTQQLAFGENSAFASAFTADSAVAGTFSIFLEFFLVIAFVIASLLVARHISTVGSSASISAVESVRRKARLYAGQASFGLAAATARNTAGRYAQYKADSDGLRDAAAQGGARGWAARRALNFSRSVGDSSFDARNVGGFGKTTGLGEGMSGGYKTRRDDIIKGEKKYAESLGQVGDSDPEVSNIKNDISEKEELLKSLKEDKNKTNDPKQKANIQEQIDATESDLKTRRTDLAQEKNRRQLGGVKFARNREEYETEKAGIENDLKELKKEYDNLDDHEVEAQNKLRKDIAEAKKKLAAANKKLQQGGYGRTVANRGWLSSLLQGRTTDQNKQAGEAIIKEWSKKINRSKEDERFDSLKAELSKSK